MRTSTRLAWPSLNSTSVNNSGENDGPAIVEPKSFETSIQQDIIMPTKSTKVLSTTELNDNVFKESSKEFTFTIRIKPEHFWIGLLMLLIVILSSSLSSSWSKIALLEDMLSMK